MSLPPPEPLYTFRGNMTSVRCCLPIIDGENELLYVGTTEGNVHVWNLKVKRQKAQHDIGTEPCLCILLVKSLFVTQQQGDSIKFWTEENNTWKLNKVLKNDYSGFCKMIFCNDLIYLPDNNSNVIIYDYYKNKEIINQCDKGLGKIMFIKFISSLDCVLVVFESCDITLWTLKWGLLSSNKFNTDCPIALDFCEHSQEGILGTNSNTLVKFKIHKDSYNIEKTEEAVMKNPGVSSVDINRNGKLCVIGCWDGRIRYYSMKKLKLLAVLSHHSESVECVVFLNKKLSFCGDGLVVAGGTDSRVSLWNLYTS